MHTRTVQITTCVLIMLGFCSGSLLATDDDSTITDQMFNGHMWQLLNESQKTIHLTGIQEGIQLCLSQIKEDLLIPPELMNSMQVSGVFDRRRMLFSMQGVSGVSTRIDGFYRHDENLAIPIIEAYRHVTLLLNFADPREAAQDLARLKLKYKN